MFFDGYTILLLAGLALSTTAWDVIDGKSKLFRFLQNRKQTAPFRPFALPYRYVGPSKSNSLPETRVMSAYEQALFRQKLQDALNELGKNPDEILADPNAHLAERTDFHFSDNRRSAISKGQLNRVSQNQNFKIVVCCRL